jgi:hypothetical protein
METTKLQPPDKVQILSWNGWRIKGKPFKIVLHVLWGEINRDFTGTGSTEVEAWNNAIRESWISLFD